MRIDEYDNNWLRPALCSLSCLFTGFSLGLLASDRSDKKKAEETYTVCYVDAKGFVIKASELEEYSETESRDIILTDADGNKVVYNIDDILVVGEYPDMDTAQSVLSIINQYQYATELPQLDESGKAYGAY